MKQVQLSDRQSSFIFYLVHEGKGRTEAARLAGFAAPRQSAFNLRQSPKIIAKIRHLYQTKSDEPINGQWICASPNNTFNRIGKKARPTQERIWPLNLGSYPDLLNIWPTSLVVKGINDPDYQSIGNIRLNYGPYKAIHCVTNEEG